MFRQKTYSRRPKDVTSLKSNERSCGEQNGKVTSFANYENDENHLSQKVSIKPAKQKKSLGTEIKKVLELRKEEFNKIDTHQLEEEILASDDDARHLEVGLLPEGHSATESDILEDILGIEERLSQLVLECKHAPKPSSSMKNMRDITPLVDKYISSLHDSQSIVFDVENNDIVFDEIGFDDSFDDVNIDNNLGDILEAQIDLVASDVESETDDNMSDCSCEVDKILKYIRMDETV